MMIRIYPWDQEGKSLAGRLGSPSVVGDRNLHGGAAASSDLLSTCAQGLLTSRGARVESQVLAKLGADPC